MYTWFKPNMKKSNSAICSQSYIKAGLVCIIDLLKKNRSFRSLDSLFNLNIETDFVEYNWLKHCVIKRIVNNVNKISEKSRTLYTKCIIYIL